MHHTKALLFLLSFLITTHPFALDYNANHTLACSTINDNYDYAANLNFLWNIIILHDIDKLAMLIFCPLIFVMQVLLMLTFIRNKSVRKCPGDIIFGLVITQTCGNLSLLASASYNSIYSYNDAMPQSFPAFCMTTAIMNVFLDLLEEFYMGFFLVYIMRSVKMSIKSNLTMGGPKKHYILVLISMLIVFGSWMLEWLGLSQFGICEISSTRNSNKQLYFPIMRLSISVLFVLFSAYTYFYFKKHMPQAESLYKRKHQENKVIARFTIGESILSVLFSIAILVVFINCLFTTPNPLFMIWATIFNICRLIQYAYLIFVVLYYKRIGNRVKKLMRRCISKQNDIDHEVINSKRLTQFQITNLQDLGLKEIVLDIQETEHEIDFLKVTQVVTILTGISISYKQYFHKFGGGEVRTIFFEELISFQIEPKLIHQYEPQAHILPKVSLLRGTFTIHAPRIFNNILEMDKMTEIAESFDLIRNCNSLYKIIESDGGKSGQFFFFTSNNKYILKTVNSSEFKFFLQNLETFYDYYIKYPNTLISKVYGAFSIKNEEINQHYHILLMKNINNCTKHQKLRTYDLKGSTHDRRIIKDYEEEHFITNQRTLKDLDFLEIQQTINIPSEHAAQLRAQLQLDSTFLRNMSLIDYSLLVVRVHWPISTNEENFWGKLQRIQNARSPEEYYHLVLIDFFQLWDFKKKGERWWKNIFGNKDTSAQEPGKYQMRFMQFINKITDVSPHRQKSNGGSYFSSEMEKATEMAELVDVKKLTEEENQNTDKATFLQY